MAKYKLARPFYDNGVTYPRGAVVDFGDRKPPSTAEAVDPTPASAEAPEQKATEKVEKKA